MKLVYVIAKILVIIGALNWGLVGVGAFLGRNLNVVNLIIGSSAQLENIVYILVGLSGLVVAWKGSKCSCD
ncbi:MAG: DUF378 domain-containing protein [Candidatus Peribacteraceae bacterium]|nr:DUF378 domain-containing protein [Candidatus Peribacteraceae bacterium]